ncbi:hypothetical protein JZ751_010330 [Albula glossodonta]|uniref:Denticleless protein homolog n=1 Tax=Albula glossodonta TaxID=121402 RepID=A0A8T2NWB2_9TELE|nr:hypothetical protein JZ751_010330 [Albula glossodonta]
MLFRSIIDRQTKNRRRNDLWPKHPLSSLLEGYQCARHDEHISYGNMGVAVPPFGCTFSTAQELQNVLAVANEEGIVRLYNTESKRSPILKEWMAHDNAIFDLAWVPGEHSLATAAGDKMAKLWDVKTGDLLGTFKGHLCSLKSVAFSRQKTAVFCTGGRDGNIMIWDTRCTKKDGFYRQVKQISGAHNKTDRNTPSKVKRKRLQPKGMAPMVDTQQSVTVVLFQDEHTLISSGAVDGIIKMWDLRKNYTVHHHEPVPMQMFPYPGSCTRKLGYSGMVLDSTGSNLFATCTDDNIYMFNVTGLKTMPVAIFSGCKNSSFYVKSCVSPDDQFLASGSSDHQAYIWKISDPKCTPMMLQGHSQEVTSVAWCPTDFTKIASCSDDNTVRIWRLDRGADGSKSSIGEANLVGWARPKPVLEARSPGGPLGVSERTPAKSPRAESLGAISSPQAAACAPSGADLPLPSSTLSTPPPVGSKPRRSATPGGSPSSIKHWLSRSPGSPDTQVTPPLRKVLSPCAQSPAPAPPTPSERRAKRRLETGEGSIAGCKGDGEGACGCVGELYPAPKRRRGLSVCRPVLDSDGRSPEEEKDDVGKVEQRPTSSQRADKENRCSKGTNWLSAMGQQLRRRQCGSSSALSRSPSATKRQDGRSTASPPMCTPTSFKKISAYFRRPPLE